MQCQKGIEEVSDRTKRLDWQVLYTQGSSTMHATVP